MKKILLILALATSTVVFAQPVIGVIKNKEGSVNILRNSEVISAKIGDSLHEGDVLKTTANSNIGIMLKDETRMAVGGNSHIVIDRFKFNPNTNNGNMLVSIVKGTFAMISGLIIKNNYETVQVKTPTSTAGVRGTYFVVEVP